MTDDVTLPPNSKDWTPGERSLFARCQARVLGNRDYKDRVLVEIMSGPLTGAQVWLREEDLTRKEPRT